MVRSPQETALDAVVKELVLGLISEGSHSKQFHLEQSLRLLCEDEWVDAAKVRFKWTGGHLNALPR